MSFWDSLCEILAGLLVLALLALGFWFFFLLPSGPEKSAPPTVEFEAVPPEKNGSKD